MLTELLTVISILLTTDSSGNTAATINNRKIDLSTRADRVSHGDVCS